MDVLKQALVDAAIELNDKHNWTMLDDSGDVFEDFLNVMFKHLEPIITPEAKRAMRERERDGLVEVARMARRRLAEMGFTVEGEL